MNIALFSFRGRLGRTEFIKVNFLVIVFVGIVQALAVPRLTRVLGPDAGIAFIFAFALLAAFVFSVALSTTVRRLHDMDRSGKWALLKFVPVANLYLLFLLLVVPGTPGENRYSVEEPDENDPFSGDRFNFSSYEAKP